MVESEKPSALIDKRYVNTVVFVVSENDFMPFFSKNAIYFSRSRLYDDIVLFDLSETKPINPVKNSRLLLNPLYHVIIPRTYDGVISPEIVAER